MRRWAASLPTAPTADGPPPQRTADPLIRPAGRQLGAKVALAFGLPWAIVAACPLYALGGLIMLGAARYYPRDIACVIAYARRPAPGGPASDSHA